MDLVLHAVQARHQQRGEGEVRIRRGIGEADFDALLLEREAHRRTHVLLRVDRGHGEISALHRRAVAEVAALELEVRGPRGFLGIDLHEAAGHVDLPLDGIEDEELGLGTEIGDVAQARALQIRLGFLRDGARVALVALAGQRLENVAGEHDGRLIVEGIHALRIGIGHEQHVGGLDALPARDRGAVECVAVLELVVAERLHGHGDVLLLSLRIGEAQVDEFDLVFLDCLEDVGYCH